MKKFILANVELKNGTWIELKLPAKKVICARCDGEGVHDHPAWSGLSPEDFGDPDFREAYFSGHYDVQCEVCKGEKIVLEIDRDALSQKMLARLERAEDTRWRHEAEAASERRMGA